ncbi:MAG: SPOR domain-containing protein, partial [Sphingomonadales bacterium]|nr:SPOR domain-containing protein [Sphingomonadales bacterium]
TQAPKLGAPLSSFAADRGLARDLLGQQALAQSDYRLALSGADVAEARRRLALSLAISGNRASAMTALAPLLQHSDVATNRVRAFVLAIGGDAEAADRALDASVPGMSRSLDPFFRRLPGLTPAQKAAAVHLGIFPGRGAAATALASSATTVPSLSVGTPTGAFPSSGEAITSNRLAGIDQLLRNPDSPSITASSAAPPPAPRPHYEIATSTPVHRSVVTVAPAAAGAPKRFWVQLASGTDEPALVTQFARMASREPDLFKGIKPYVSQVSGRSKLLIGPFKSNEDSDTFVENLAEARINGFSWTSPEGQVVRKLQSP